MSDLPADASARARAASYRAGTPISDGSAPRPQRRWPRYVAAAVGGLVAATSIVLVTGWPANRPSLAHLRYLQQGLDESIERWHTQGVHTRLDLIAGRVVVDQKGLTCAPTVGFGNDHPVTAEDWSFVDFEPRLFPCNTDI